MLERLVGNTMKRNYELFVVDKNLQRYKIISLIYSKLSYLTEIINL